MTTDRCPTCDREIAGADSIGEGKCEVQVSFDSKQRRAGGWNLQAVGLPLLDGVSLKEFPLAAAINLATAYRPEVP